MTLRQYLVLMSLGTLLCWVIWFFVLFRTDPNTSGVLVFFFFYFSLFLALLGTLSVGGFLSKRLLVKNDEAVFRFVKRTFRQSVVVAIFMICGLFLLQKDLLRWWNAILLFVLLFFVEGIIFAGRKFNNADYVK